MRLELNKPFTTDLPAIEIDAGLPSGVYTFRLVVVDSSGRSSQPATASVTILPRSPIPDLTRDPDLVVRPLDPRPLEPRPVPVEPLITPRPRPVRPPNPRPLPPT